MVFAESFAKSIFAKFCIVFAFFREKMRHFTKKFARYENVRIFSVKFLFARNAMYRKCLQSNGQLLSVNDFTDYGELEKLILCLPKHTAPYIVTFFTDFNCIAVETTFPVHLSTS